MPGKELGITKLHENFTKGGKSSVSKFSQKSAKPKNLKEVHAADVYHAGKVIPMSQYLLSLVRQK